MRSILMQGVLRAGRVEVGEPIYLPDGSEVTITGQEHIKFPGLSDNDRPMTADEIAATLTAMDQVAPFDITDEERAGADAWEKQVNDYTIAHLDRGLEDVFSSPLIPDCTRRSGLLG